MPYLIRHGVVALLKSNKVLLKALDIQLSPSANTHLAIGFHNSLSLVSWSAAKAIMKSYTYEVRTELVTNG